jgi:hypothetical protein
MIKHKKYFIGTFIGLTITFNTVYAQVLEFQLSDDSPCINRCSNVTKKSTLVGKSTSSVTGSGGEYTSGTSFFGQYTYKTTDAGNTTCTDSGGSQYDCSFPSSAYYTFSCSTSNSKGTRFNYTAPTSKSGSSYDSSCSKIIKECRDTCKNVNVNVLKILQYLPTARIQQIAKSYFLSDMPSTDFNTKIIQSITAVAVQSIYDPNNLTNSR